MRRGGVLMFAAVPVAITAGAFFLMPTDSAESPAGPSVSAAQQAREEAKERAETERAEDEKTLASLPPGLADPAKKDLALKITATAELSSLDWRLGYASIKDNGNGCGYTAGTGGFCTGTHDLLALVERYTKAHPDNGLARYLPALREVDGTDSHEGLDPGFTAAWKAEAEKPAFRKAQDKERDRVYFNPAVRLAKLDGLGTLGQFVYYDAMVFHGPDPSPNGFYGLRERVLNEAKLPSRGGSEKAYLDIFLDLRKKAMKAKQPDADTSRIDTAQRPWLYNGNLDLSTPLSWRMYGEPYHLP
ncbi:chitosanase [Streptomyces sp. TRM68416]|uniref:chitosanase n=1 Tax=Streptomyces sp. TRM68416 TaxID=2758412 RepID=UPI002948BFCB|nr:chitosanase [Streptomyces sp. TRM68416]